MQTSTVLHKTGMALLLVAGLLPVACSEDATAPSDYPYAEALTAAERFDQSRPPGLRLSVENGASTYVDRSDDPWLSQSIVTDNNPFDVVVQNASRWNVQDVTLLVTIDGAFLQQAGWQVEVDGEMLEASDFTGTDPKDVGFHEAPHGIFPPGGPGIFYPHRMEGELLSGDSWRVQIRSSSGGLDGFRIHFEAASSRLSNTPRNDITAIPPPDPLSPIVACCYPDGRCEMVTANDCAEFDGISHGEGSTCDPYPCGE